MTQTTPKSLSLMILLAAGSLILPACGSQNAVKSQKASTTVLDKSPSASNTTTRYVYDAQGRPTTVVYQPPANSANEAKTIVYGSGQGLANVGVRDEEEQKPAPATKEIPGTFVQTIKKTSTHLTVKPGTMIQPPAKSGSVPTPAAQAKAPVNASPVAITPQKKNDSSPALTWIILAVILALFGWYFWPKTAKKTPTAAQPKPPVGGLSPVSGFMAAKGRGKVADSKPSFWNKKLF